MPKRLYAVPVRAVRHDLTDEVVCDIYDADTDEVYQMGRGVHVRYGMAPSDVREAMAKMVDELEAEANTPAPPLQGRAPQEVPLPRDLINVAVDREANARKVS